MPRKHRAARERATRPRTQEPVSLAPGWAHRAGYTVRQVSGDRPYRCPGCDQLIPPGMEHIVAVPDADPASRRHWHGPCWRTELRAPRHT